MDTLHPQTPCPPGSTLRDTPPPEGETQQFPLWGYHPQGCAGRGAPLFTSSPPQQGCPGTARHLNITSSSRHTQSRCRIYSWCPPPRPPDAGHKVNTASGTVLMHSQYLCSWVGGKHIVPSYTTIHTVVITLSPLLEMGRL